MARETNSTTITSRTTHHWTARPRERRDVVWGGSADWAITGPGWAMVAFETPIEAK